MHKKCVKNTDRKREKQVWYTRSRKAESAFPGAGNIKKHQ